MTQYQGKTVVITGAASGLGAAMADVFAAAGARLALLDIDGERAQAKASVLRDAGVDVLALPVDVANKASLAAVAEAVQNRFGSCDVLCANVGVQQFGAIDTLTDEDWAWVLSVNVAGVINTVACFLPLLRKASGERHIVLTASASYFTPGVRMAAYVTSKYAVVGYGEVLRQELAEEDINVALLFPAGMATRHLQSSVAARPAELGESRLQRADIDAMMASADMTQENHVATAEHAVRNLLSELQEKHPYIITHGAYKTQVEKRQRSVLDAFDRMLANP
ncbi:MAG: SDR family NAD(P)-dependent oxidoreductase [Haliea sp.]|nr:SDR family NAD(P)-dependent oxidoreductase [Haliea sp.]